ncbi:MAG: hypothetical protein M1818_001744 [Claussenomyces sp. TS43310]|nr:MAG: hypothetical protein M1818_001744 [Claussenomyces sp. TS43310]
MSDAPLPSKAQGPGSAGSTGVHASGPTGALDNVVLATKSAHPDQYLVAIIDTPRSGSSIPSLDTTVADKPHEAFVHEFLFQDLPPQLNLPAENLYVLISTKSGTERAETWFKSILKPILHTVGLDEPKYTVITTSSRQSILDFARTTLIQKAAIGTRQTVLLLSGDGGVVDVINGLTGGGARPESYVRPIISILPHGTGNALFHHLHRKESPAEDSPSQGPEDLVLGLRTLIRGDHRPLPMFCATFSPGACILSDEGQSSTPVSSHTIYGAVVASYGFHASLVADSDTVEWRKQGDKRFGMVAQNLLYPSDGTLPHAYKARVTLYRAGKNDSKDGTSSFNSTSLGGDELAYVLLTMVSNLEKTFTISPASRPLDGQMRIVHFGPRSGHDILKIMQMAYDGGKHVGQGRDLVNYEEVEGMRIDFLEAGVDGKWRQVCIDGLIIRVEEGGWVEVRKVPEEESVLDVMIG